MSFFLANVRLYWRMYPRPRGLRNCTLFHIQKPRRGANHLRWWTRVRAMRWAAIGRRLEYALWLCRRREASARPRDSRPVSWRRAARCDRPTLKISLTSRTVCVYDARTHAQTHAHTRTNDACKGYFQGYRGPSLLPSIVWFSVSFQFFFECRATLAIRKCKVENVNREIGRGAAEQIASLSCLVLY